MEWGGRAKSGYQVEKYRQKESKNANEPTMSLLRKVSRYVATDPWGMTGHAWVLLNAGKLNNPKMFDPLGNVLLRFDHVACFIVNANHGMM